MVNIRFVRAIGFEDRPVRSYQLCNRLFIAAGPFPELSAFQSKVNLAVNSIHPAEPLQLAADPKLVYHGPGWLTNRMVDVQCHRYLSTYQLVVEGIGTFLVDDRGETITQLEADPDNEPASLREVVLGPALILALALQGTWCLHAGAIVTGSRITAFLGESGLGKSTLASFLGTQAGIDWRLAADDILPLTFDPAELVTLPHFPQLKLPAEKQPARYLPERAPLDSIYILTQPDDPSQEAAATLLSPRDGALALLRHTVAARLFDEHLLTEHLAFCARVATTCPIYLLTYPHDRQSLVRVQDIVSNGM